MIDLKRTNPELYRGQRHSIWRLSKEERRAVPYVAAAMTVLLLIISAFIAHAYY